MSFKFEMSDCVDLCEEVFKSSSAHVSEELKKGLSFDLVNIQTANPAFFNHYMFLDGENGGFAPHQSQYFREGRHDSESYRLNDLWWRDAKWEKFNKSLNRLKKVSKSVDKLIRVEE